MEHLKVDVERITDTLWVARAGAIDVSETGESYQEAIDALKTTVGMTMTNDVVIDVTVRGIDD